MNLSTVQWTGLLSGVAAVILLGLNWQLAILPLCGFLLLCVMAPFVPQIGFFSSVFSRGSSKKKAVALTFDDGPDPRTTPALLKLLAAHQVTATFFVLGWRAKRFPELITAILAHGHTIGNHSYRHDHFASFKGRDAIRNEIDRTQAELGRLGIVPLIFRPPVGIVDPRLAYHLSESGMSIVNFSCRAYDYGNRNIFCISRRILSRVRQDDIVLLHDLMPKKKGQFTRWLKELEVLLSGLNQKGLSVLPLSDLIGRPVMKLIVNGNETLR